MVSTNAIQFTRYSVEPVSGKCTSLRIYQSLIHHLLNLNYCRLFFLIFIYVTKEGPFHSGSLSFVLKGSLKRILITLFKLCLGHRTLTSKTNTIIAVIVSVFLQRNVVILGINTRLRKHSY